MKSGNYLSLKNDSFIQDTSRRWILILTTNKLMSDLLDVYLTAQNYFRVSCIEEVEAISILLQDGTPDLLVIIPSASNQYSIGDILRIKGKFSEIPIALALSKEEVPDLEPLVDSGMSGVIYFEDGLVRFLNALNFMLAGEFYFRDAVSRVQRGHSHQYRNQLSDIEMRIIHSVKKGMKNKEIAIHLGIKEAKVKMHLREIFRVFEVNNRTQLATKSDFYRVHPEQSARAGTMV